MKNFAPSAILALLAGSACAAPVTAPAQVVQARQFEAGIKFIGVDPNDSYSMSFPTNAEPLVINNAKSVSKISSAGGAVCSFFGIDGSDTVVVGEQEVDVGPPQVQVKGVCDSL